MSEQINTNSAQGDVAQASNEFEYEYVESIPAEEEKEPIQVVVQQVRIQRDHYMMQDEVDIIARFSQPE